jgi:serine/threonine-protein kinase
VKEIDGKYEIVRKLGAGGMGSVFEARHRTTNRRVAVKVILEEARLEAGVVARFQREARAVASMDSEHITQVLDGGVDAETKAPYLVMELLAGEDLDTLLKRIGVLRSDVALRIVAQLLEGLERAHEAGVIHRDIKPANVFLARKSGGEIIVKICDFGIAKVKADPLASAQDVALTQTSSLIGSPMYMSPEQAKGAKNLDARADVWSAGVVLFQLLTGVTPHHDADTLGLLLLAICSENAPPVRLHAPWVSEEASAVVSRALDMDVATRFQSAREMRDAIALLLTSGTTIDESMLTPLRDEDRAKGATVIVPGAAAPSALAAGNAATLLGPPGAPLPRTEAAPALPGASITSSSMEAASPVPERRRTARTAALVVLAAAAIGGVALGVSSSRTNAGGGAMVAAAVASPGETASGTASAAAATASIVAEPNTSTTASASAGASAGTAKTPPKASLGLVGGRTPPRPSSGATSATSTTTTTATGAAPSSSTPILRDWH